MILYTLNYVKCSRLAMMVLFSDLLFQTNTWWAEPEATDLQEQLQVLPQQLNSTDELKSIKSKLKKICRGLSGSERENWY